MTLLFVFSIVSIICGVFCLCKDTYDYLFVMIYMLCGELAIFIFFVFALTRFMPMKKINDLRDEKISLELDRNKINHDLTSIFNNKEGIIIMKTSQLITAAGIGALYAIFSLIGGSITALVGIPAVGGVVTTFFGAIFFVLSCLVIKRFGAATITGFVYSIVALGLPVMGPPGFLPKIVIGALAGLVADILYVLLKRKEKVAVIGIGAISQITIAFANLGFGFLFSIPGIEKLAKLFLSVVTISALLIIGGIGGLIGYIIFNKLRNTAVVRKIQG